MDCVHQTHTHNNNNKTSVRERRNIPFSATTNEGLDRGVLALVQGFLLLLVAVRQMRKAFGSFSFIRCVFWTNG